MTDRPPGGGDPGRPERAALARALLRRAREALADAALLAATGGSLRGAGARAADAALLGARALLVPRGIDRADPAAACLLFDLELVATDLVSRACGEAVHRALRARRELEEGDVSSFYPARIQSIRDGAAALLAEAEIILDRDLGPAEEPERAADEDEL